MLTYTINGVIVHALPVKDTHDMVVGYTVSVEGALIGNRIARNSDLGGSAVFRSIARNERVIADRDTLREAVEDVLNDGMRDRGRA